MVLRALCLCFITVIMVVLFSFTDLEGNRFIYRYNRALMSGHLQNDQIKNKSNVPLYNNPHPNEPVKKQKTNGINSSDYLEKLKDVMWNMTPYKVESLYNILNSNFTSIELEGVHK
uniref:Uncharacterized protein n=1 Tax=Euplotes harpa TaxID=151035 RepID=A0A7S3JGL9_9SPIT|mmetsp:Transcript_3971/g.4854  ORF Transcript_3971/g.4854 Transcript_3971/m.4854 type:complete len:116 (+) Transcript_3971:3-350(+)